MISTRKLLSGAGRAEEPAPCGGSGEIRDFVLFAGRNCEVNCPECGRAFTVRIIRTHAGQALPGPRGIVPRHRSKDS